MGTIYKKVEAAIAALEPSLGPTATRELRQWYTRAFGIVMDLAKANTNLAFHEWWAKAVTELKIAGMQNADTLGPVLVHIAWDQVKKNLSNWLMRKIFRPTWQFFSRIGLDTFLKDKATPLINAVLNDILPDLLSASNNASLREVRDKLFMVLHEQYGNLSKTYKGLIVQAALAIAQKKGLV